MTTPIEALKNYFLNGNKPTQNEFHEWLDSYFHHDSEEIHIQETRPGRREIEIGTDASGVDFRVNGRGYLDSLKTFVIRLAASQAQRESESPVNNMGVDRYFYRPHYMGGSPTDYVQTMNFYLDDFGWPVAFPGEPRNKPNPYLFRVGHYDNQNRLPSDVFNAVFTVNQDGDIRADGAKEGFVTDRFINRFNDKLETGDVVVISSHGAQYFYGHNDSIPVSEVDLSSKANDTAVCGIVAKVVTEDEVMGKEQIAKKDDELSLSEHSAKYFNGLDKSVVLPNQLGKMVTHGAYTYCKVDADITPIDAGDLLTTSSTKGHAQKVIDKVDAIGAIVGKALRSLEKGKAKIPVMVMMN